MVVKALKISELAQMARIETRFQEYASAQWTAHVKSAIAAGARATEQGKSDEKVIALVNSAMSPWAGKVVPVANKATKDIYRLGRVVGWKRAVGKIKGKKALEYMAEDVAKAKGVAAEVFPGFELADEQAIGVLSDHNVYWIGAHYDKHLAETIATTVRDTLVAHGTSRAVAASALKEALAKQFPTIAVPGGYKGSADNYFRGLAANTATVARVFGQVNSFVAFDVIELEVVNPNDDRTSRVCQHMSGKVFTVEQAKTQMDAELSAKDPDEVKKIHPWLKMDELKSISPKAGHIGKADQEALAKAGLPLPPYHFRCRSTVDIRS